MANSTNNTNNRGFAAMDKDEVSKIAKKGAAASTGKFGSENGADPHKAGQAGAKAQPTEAKREGGKNSHRSS
jgi:general stress protein YciG